MKKAELDTAVKTTDKYVDSNGKERFKGNANLRPIQPPAHGLAFN